MYIKREIIENAFELILDDIGNPPVELLNRKEYEKRTGRKIPSGVAAECNYTLESAMIWVSRDQASVADLFDSIWHEILHFLFPHCSENWIALCSYTMSGFKDNRITPETEKEYAHMIPSKQELLAMMRMAVKVVRKEVA